MHACEAHWNPIAQALAIAALANCQIARQKTKLYTNSGLPNKYAMGSVITIISHVPAALSLARVGAQA